MNEYEKALALREETAAHRRWFHRNAEVGLNMPKAAAYVTQTLKKYGLEPTPCGHGVAAVLGRGGKCILLRADMDALPMKEESGESFACPSGTEAHTCGHDLHAAMLLTAARLLKERESTLKGTVKFMFQPGEETFEGARDMIAAGILENPKVDAAMAVHVTAGRLPAGSYMYNDSGAMMCSADGFRITISGKGGHGAYPHTAVDPIHIGAHICLALEGLIAREADPKDTNVLTIGRFQAGSAPNIIPGEAILEGTIRCDSPEMRKKLVGRMQELAESTAKNWGGSAKIDMLSQVPPLICDGGLTREIVGYLQELDIPGAKGIPGIRAGASEDFAAVTEQVPGTFLYLSAGFPDQRGDAPAHNPKVRFNEDVLPVGAALLSHCAARWLADNARGYYEPERPAVIATPLGPPGSELLW